MGLEAWFTVAVVLAVIGLLATETLRPAVTVLGATILLFVTGVISDDQAFAGFSNSAPITVAALYIVAGAVERTGALERLADRLLERRPPTADKPGLLELARLLLPVAGASAVLNNTPVVAMVAPRVVAWARRTGRSPSHYLMPISFATILGGVVTTIGTSTNLVVNGLMVESGVEPIGLFELSRAGLPVALAGLVVLLVAGRFLLVRRDSPGGPGRTTARQYTVAMTVPSGSPLVGVSVGEAGLRNLVGVFLVEVERGSTVIAPVGPTETLCAGDRLAFVGDVSRVVDLHGIRGLEPAEWHSELGAGTQKFFEVVVTPDSPLAGQTLKSVGFRARYAAAVIAVHRGGERLTGKLGTVTLHPGDVLLLLSDPGFAKRWRNRGDFLLVSGTPGDSRPRRHHARFVQLVLLGTVGAAGTGLMDILPAALTAVGLLLASRVISVEEARRSLDVNVLVLIAASFGLGAALTETGLAASLADGLSSVTAGLGEPGLLIGILLATSVLTSAVNNNASAVLMWPIALSTATTAGLDPRAFAVAVMLGASMDFLTPVGYQTNTMVYGMGGYRFADFPRLGLPLTVATLAAAALVIPSVWPLN